MKKDYQVVNSFNNDEQNRCVDIIHRHDGQFMYQEWRREPEDISGWFLMRDSHPLTYLTADDAILAASQMIDWFQKPR